MSGLIHKGFCAPNAWRLLALLAFALLPCGALFAANAPAGPIGVVDMEALSKGFTGNSLAMQRIDNYQKEREDAFGLLQKGIGLTPEEFTDFADRIANTVQIQAEKDKTDALIKKAAENSDKYQKLKDRQDKNEALSDDEKAQLAALEKDIQTVMAKINESRNRMVKEINTEIKRYNDLLIAMIDKAVANVAAKQKVAIVVTKEVPVNDGTARFVLWGGQDITPDVITYLNTNFKPEQLDAKPATTDNKPN